ncbi:hypothetical protein K402DRAFT_457420 [Aulographum hederae CBS 113979]|uniref:DUF7918 domain-containing protein n=1 Tax=Aulographum hederae CBS 113979 TaxID=1176131 RepID=A0A6G1GMV0_9PEZI|nr:hypothetical protein K402DRAFT_457420 [Aulographum hederae CBS 113979]
MPILPEFPEVEVDVVVGGRPLKEYRDEEEEDAVDDRSCQRCVRYIEAVSGAQFGIRVRYNPHKNKASTLSEFDISLSVDGRENDSGSLSSKNRRFEKVLRGSSVFRKGRWTRELLIFAPLDIVNELPGTALGSRSTPKIDELGEITVRLRRVVLGQKQECTDPKKWNNISMGAIGPIPEKLLKGKAMTYHVQSSPIESKAPGFRERTYPDGKRNYFAVVKYKYRSQDALKSLLVIPRSPTPHDVEDRPVEELNAEEMRQLLRRYKEREQQTEGGGPAIKRETKMKRERKEMNENENEENMESDATRRVKARRSANVGGRALEVIDLT